MTSNHLLIVGVVLLWLAIGLAVAYFIMGLANDTGAPAGKLSEADLDRRQCCDGRCVQGRHCPIERAERMAAHGHTAVTLVCSALLAALGAALWVGWL